VFTHASTDDLLRLWPTATDQGWDDEMHQALTAAAQLQEVPPAQHPAAAPVATPAANPWATWPASPQGWPADTAAAAAAMPRPAATPVSSVFGPGMSMSTLAPEDLAAINAHLKAQAARREQQSPGGGLAASPVVPTHTGRAPMSLSDAIMLDLRPIVAQRPTTGANAARAIPVHGAAGPSDAPPPPSGALAPFAHSGPLRMRTASAKAVAAAETEQLLGQLDKAGDKAPPPPAAAAAAPTAPPPASAAPAEAAPKPRSAAPPSPKSGGPKRRRENSGSGGAAVGGSDTCEEGETSDDDGLGIGIGDGDGNADPRRQRRVLSNRESARRSRRRKMERLHELASERDAARQECAVLRAALLQAGIPLPSGVMVDAPGVPVPCVKAETEPKHDLKGVKATEAGKVAAPQAPVATAAAEEAAPTPIAKPAPAAPAAAVQPPSARVTRAAQTAQTPGVSTRRSSRRPKCTVT
jgi:hypothetical protein